MTYPDVDPSSVADETEIDGGRFFVVRDCHGNVVSTVPRSVEKNCGTPGDNQVGNKSLVDYESELQVLEYSERSDQLGMYPYHIRPANRYKSPGPGNWKVIFRGSFSECCQKIDEDFGRSPTLGYLVVQMKRLVFAFIMNLPEVFDIKDLPCEPGVYFVCDGDVVLYVGKSINLRERWGRQHSLKQDVIDNGYSIRFRCGKSLSFLGNLELEENMFISLLTPPRNKRTNATTINAS